MGDPSMARERNSLMFERDDHEIIGLKFHATLQPDTPQADILAGDEGFPMLPIDLLLEEIHVPRKRVSR